LWRSFSLTAAGQSWIHTRFPFQPPCERRHPPDLWFGRSRYAAPGYDGFVPRRRDRKQSVHPL